MSQQNSTPNSNILRWIGISIPILMMILAIIFMNGIPRVLSTIICIMLFLLIIVPKQLTSAYKTLALLIMNTFLCFIVIEALSIITLFVTDNVNNEQKIISYSVSNEARANLSYYQNAEWGTTHWQEFGSLSGVYFPYILWRRDTYAGETITVDNNYRRIVPNTQCDEENPYTVYMFGGSTMWGTGAPDWGTIPAYLQTLLDEQLDTPVCIINYADTAYVSTQELLLLILELQSGQAPNLVIFYDGINDAINSNIAQQPAIHARLDLIDSQLANDLPTFQSNTIRLLSQFINIQNNTTNLATDYEIGFDASTLSEEIALTYLSNYQTVQQLADLHDFDFAFFMQPLVFIGDKLLTEEEQLLMAELTRFGDTQNIVNDLYDYGEDFDRENTNLFSLSDIFDEETQVLYADFMHLVPEGNEIVAREIFERLRLITNTNTE